MWVPNLAAFTSLAQLLEADFPTEQIAIVAMI